MAITHVFESRRQAGIALAEAVAKLPEFAGVPTKLDLSQAPVVVLALPRGGVPIGYQIANRLGAPLDVLVVRKLGVPGHEELALGAIASGGVRVLNTDVIASLRIAPEVIDDVAAREQRELERRERLYRGLREPATVEDRTVILVDDGLATGATMRAAASSLRQRGPRAIIAAVPVGAASSCALLSRIVDRLICLTQPEPFYGVGMWYREFDQTSDDEVRRLLERAAHGERDGHGAHSS